MGIEMQHSVYRAEKVWHVKIVCENMKEIHYYTNTPNLLLPDGCWTQGVSNGLLKGQGS